MSNIEHNVMAAVRVIHAGRLLMSKTALEMYALVFSFVGIATMVSVSSVANNFALVAGSGVVSVLTYVAVAIANTDALVQMALLLGTLSLVLLVRDIASGYSRQSALAL